MHAAHRRPSRESTRHSAASTKPSWRLIAGVAAGIVALCTVAVGVGVHAALGDGDGPAVQLANRGVDLRPESERGGASDVGDGSAAGSPDADAPSAQAPVPSTRGGRPADPPASAAPSPAPPSVRPSTPPGTAPPSGQANPYLDPADPRYVPEAERTAWLDGQARVRACMVAAGQQYLEWEWWQGGSPMPAGLDEGAETAWRIALQGDEGTAGCDVEAGDAPTPPPGAGSPENATPPPAAPEPEPDAGTGGRQEQQLAPPSGAPEASESPVAPLA